MKIRKVGALTIAAQHAEDRQESTDVVNFLRSQFTHEELLQVTAALYVQHRAERRELKLRANAADDEAEQLSRENGALIDWIESVQKVAAEGIPAAFDAGLAIPKAKASQRGKASADALHSKQGGTRENQAAIRTAWATGKYSSRNICAEQECAGLGMSFSTARRALRNTPNPS
jgi:hypothetical protein